MDVGCELLTHKNQEVFVPALKFVGQILSVENDDVTLRCLKHDALKNLLPLTYDANVFTIKNACWALNNFVLSGVEHASAFILEGGYERVLGLCDHMNNDIRSEALFCMCSCIEIASKARDHGCTMKLSMF